MANLYPDEVLNINRPAKEILIERHNRINGTEFDPDHFALTDLFTEADPKYNTSVWVRPTITSPWQVGFKIYYTRTGMNDVFRFPTEVRANGFTTLYELLPLINAEYGIYISEADVEDAEIIYTNPDDATSPASVVITAKLTSFMFLGTFTLNLNVRYAYGISTFEQEIVHYVHLYDSATEKSTIEAYNSIGDRYTNFSFGVNVEWDTVVIADIWVRPDGSLVMTGTFRFYENINGTMLLQEASVIEMSTQGRVISHKPSRALYGFDYGYNDPNLKYPDFVLNKLWFIDRDNLIGGVSHRLHSYDMTTGEYDSSNDFTINGKALAVCRGGDYLYVAVEINPEVLEDTIYLCRIGLDGKLDEEFDYRFVATAPISGQMYAIKDMDFNEGLLAIAVRLELNGEASPYYSDPALDWKNLPVFIFGEDGTMKNQDAFYNDHYSKQAAGAGAHGVAVSADGVFYTTIGIDKKYYGLDLLTFRAINTDGELTESIPPQLREEYSTSPYYSGVLKVSRGVRNTVYVTKPDVYTATTRIEAYDSTGTFIGNFLEFDSMVKDHFIHRFT